MELSKEQRNSVKSALRLTARLAMGKGGAKHATTGSIKTATHALRATKAARHAAQALPATAPSVPPEKHSGTGTTVLRARAELDAQQAKAAVPARRVGSLSMALATALSAPQRQSILKMASVHQRLAALHLRATTRLFRMVFVERVPIATLR